MSRPRYPSSRAATTTLVVGLALATVAGAAAPVSAATTDPLDTATLATDGRALVQAARESGDSRVLDSAAATFRQLLETEPRNVDALVGLGTVALSAHDFDTALRFGQRAVEAGPSSPSAIGVTVDALTQLGRYDEAADAIERMLLIRPDLASYSRLSYHHELHGRLDLAVDAMERAVVAGGPFVENTEHARVLLGNLWLLRGDVERARLLYETALARQPGYVPATIALARVEVAVGDHVAAIERITASIDAAVGIDRLPHLYSERAQLHEAAGDVAAATADYEYTRALEADIRADGATAEPDMAILESDRGSVELGLELARAAYDAAPSIEAADALAWAHHRAAATEDALRYSHEALRTGSRDPDRLYRAGVIAVAAGEPGRASELLEAARLGAAAGSPTLTDDIAETLGSLAASR